MFNRIFIAAQGYLQLGMVEESLTELNRLTEDDASRPEAMQLRVWVLMRLKRWNEALDFATALCRALPELPVPFLDAAYCLHEMNRTQEAHSCLEKGPRSLREYPTYHYNLACYDATLGRTEDARKHLLAAINMEPRYEQEAMNDPDLKSLYEKGETH